jgi:hypothetical protein
MKQKEDITFGSSVFVTIVFAIMAIYTYNTTSDFSRGSVMIYPLFGVAIGVVMMIITGMQKMKESEREEVQERVSRTIKHDKSFGNGNIKLYFDSANKSVTLSATSTSDAHKETIDNFQYTDAVETDYHVVALDMNNLKVLCAGNNKGILSKELCDLGKELRGLGINVKPSTPAIKAFNDYGFITDDVNEFVVIATPNRIYVHRYSDIVSIAYEENGTDVFNKSIGGAVAGGILFGGVGAIVGGSTAKAKQNKEVSKMSIKILLKSTTNPTIILPIYEVGKDGSLIETKNAADKIHYEGLLKEVSGIKDIFSIIIDIVDRNIKVQQATPLMQNTSSNSVADELEKLAKLKDSGILTEAEFNAQKSKLLNL